jgi:hypothetical protein
MCANPVADERPLTPLEKARAAKALGVTRAKKATRNSAIRDKCRDCQGGEADPDLRGRIRACPITECALYQFRPYQGK